jgi:hypothetical protein
LPARLRVDSRSRPHGPRQRERWTRPWRQRPRNSRGMKSRGARFELIRRDDKMRIVELADLTKDEADQILAEIVLVKVDLQVAA